MLCFGYCSVAFCFLIKHFKKKKKKKATGRLYNSHVHIKKLKENIFIILLECSLKIICMLNTHLAMMIIYKMRIKKAGGTCNFNQQ